MTLRRSGSVLLGVVAVVLLAGDRLGAGEDGTPARAEVLDGFIWMIRSTRPSPERLARLKAHEPTSWRALENAALDADSPGQILNVVEYALALRIITPCVWRGVARILGADGCIEGVVDAITHRGPNEYLLSVRRRRQYFGPEPVERAPVIVLYADPRATEESLSRWLLGKRVMFALRRGPGGWTATRAGLWSPTDREQELFVQVAPLLLTDPDALLTAMASGEPREAWLATVRVVSLARELGRKRAPWAAGAWIHDDLLAARPSIRATLRWLRPRLVWNPARRAWTLRGEVE